MTETLNHSNPKIKVINSCTDYLYKTIYKRFCLLLYLVFQIIKHISFIFIQNYISEIWFHFFIHKYEPYHNRTRLPVCTKTQIRLTLRELVRVINKVLISFPSFSTYTVPFMKDHFLGLYVLKKSSKLLDSLNGGLDMGILQCYPAGGFITTQGVLGVPRFYYMKEMKHGITFA